MVVTNNRRNHEGINSKANRSTAALRGGDDSGGDDMNWRAELQEQINMNNAVREMSLRRIGDEKTEYAPCLDGAGRPREVQIEEIEQ